MKIKWLGHACFLLTAESGVRVLADPFDDKVGYPLPQVEVDIVTVSHSHSDHSYTQALRGNFSVFDQAGLFECQGIGIQGFSTFHDAEQGAIRGLNLVFKITMDGISVLHCGDLGHILSVELAREIGRVDVLLVPVGGRYTIDCNQAFELTRLLNPAITIPMHYQTPVLTFPIQPVDPFLQAMGGGRSAGSQEITVSRETLKQQAGVVVLDYPRHPHN